MSWPKKKRKKEGGFRELTFCAYFAKAFASHQKCEVMLKNHVWRQTALKNASRLNAYNLQIIQLLNCSLHLPTHLYLYIDIQTNVTLHLFKQPAQVHQHNRITAKVHVVLWKCHCKQPRHTVFFSLPILYDFILVHLHCCCVLLVLLAII